jgi:hypothetical protein
MTPFEQLASDADAGNLSAARMVVGVLSTASDDAPEPSEWLDIAIRYARQVAAAGDRWDVATLIHVLMKRAAQPGGIEAGGEAVSLIEADAQDGNEESAASLQLLADRLPSDMVASIFPEAKRQLCAGGRPGGSEN